MKNKLTPLIQELKEWIAAAMLSQEDVALKLKITFPTLSRLLNGHTKPSLATSRKIKRLLAGGAAK